MVIKIGKFKMKERPKGRKGKNERELDGGKKEKTQTLKKNPNCSIKNATVAVTIPASFINWAKLSSFLLIKPGPKQIAKLSAVIKLSSESLVIVSKKSKRCSSIVRFNSGNALITFFACAYCSFLSAPV